MRLAMFSVRAFVLVSLFATIAFSQTTQLTGTVSDQSAAVAPGAKVTAVNVDTRVARSSVANQSGNYLITALLPGSYRVTAEAPGFKQAVRELVRLEVDQVARLDFTLEVGEARETVSIEATAVLLDSATSTIGTTVESRQVSELPLNGRNPIDLLALSTGIRIQAGFGGRSVQVALPAAHIRASPSTEALPARTRPW